MCVTYLLIPMRMVSPTPNPEFEIPGPKPSTKPPDPARLACIFDPFNCGTFLPRKHHQS